MRRAIGWMGVIMSIPLLLWALVGFLPFLPSVIDVFGIEGLRMPASVTIAGLLLAAFGFHEP